MQLSKTRGALKVVVLGLVVVGLAVGCSDGVALRSATRPGYSLTTAKITDSESRLDAIVERVMAQTGIPGVAVGVVHDPLHQEVFTAIRDGGARRNGLPISVSEETSLAHALVATGFSYEPERRVRQVAVLSHLIGSIRDVRRMGAASVDLCSVACGRVDAYYERGLQPWDHAAGALIAMEAGARVENLSGGAPDFGFCLAAPPALFDELRSMLLAADAGNA